MPHTLLLADDSVTIQRLVELTFANEPVTVVIAGDGRHAVSMLADLTPDIVLADISMPGLDGYELTRHIRQTPALATVPVLLLVGAFESIDSARANDVGADGVLTKPLEPQVVVARVNELLAGRALPDAPALVPPPRPPQAERLDDYFAELDHAISTRAAAAPVAAPSAHADLPSPSALAGAFSALLAAEQSGAAPEAFVEWLPEELPSPPAAVPPVTTVITDEVIEQIVDRVLARISTSVVQDTVREAVSSVASTTAERLVREEIDRIKSHIK